MTYEHFFIVFKITMGLNKGSYNLGPKLWLLKCPHDHMIKIGAPSHVPGLMSAGVLQLFPHSLISSFIWATLHSGTQLQHKASALSRDSGPSAVSASCHHPKTHCKTWGKVSGNFYNVAVRVRSIGHNFGYGS